MHFQSQYWSSWDVVLLLWLQEESLLAHEYGSDGREYAGDVDGLMDRGLAVVETS